MASSFNATRLTKMISESVPYIQRGKTDRLIWKCQRTSRWVTIYGVAQVIQLQIWRI